jgi:hypothetical protein
MVRSEERTSNGDRWVGRERHQWSRRPVVALGLRMTWSGVHILRTKIDPGSIWQQKALSPSRP